MSQQQDQQHMHGERRQPQSTPYEGEERRKPMVFDESGEASAPNADNEDEQSRLNRIRPLES